MKKEFKVVMTSDSEGNKDHNYDAEYIQDWIKRCMADFPKYPVLGKGDPWTRREYNNWFKKWFSQFIEKARNMNEKPWHWFGNPGHFIGGSECRFHLCTEIGEYLVSTVGEYHPYPEKPMRTIGGGSKDFFETYVFRTTGQRCECGCGMPDIELSEIEGIRYATRKEANDGHLEMCQRYSEFHNKQRGA